MEVCIFGGAQVLNMKSTGNMDVQIFGNEDLLFSVLVITLPSPGATLPSLV